MTEMGWELSRNLDAVAIGPNHGFADMKKLVQAAIKYEWKLIYGLNCYYDYLLSELKGTNTIIGGGLCSASTGFESTEQKIFLAELYQSMGCGEIDLYINIPYIRDGKEELALKELKQIRDVTKCTMKVIIEAPILNDEQIKRACQIVIDSGADYIKTGTGFLGATTLEIVKKVMDQARNKILVKAAGGIMGYETINAMKNMGVDRFGMGYEKAIRLMEEMKNKGKERYHGEIYS